ncbi:recombinase family protein [Nonomuraea sp. NPDC046570]|uniref:recombinase family protein n=1 Tax=Nonomuraea sp. NPDC046570 TaxID=3155255 RepID=UPI003400FEA1
MPALAKALTVATPTFRKLSTAWIELPRPAMVGTEPVGHVRIGYARASTVRQSLGTQLDALQAAGVTHIFSEKISTRPELDKAIALARELRSANIAVTLVVHEHKRLGRGLDMAALAEQLRAAGIGLEFLTGDLQGSHDPAGGVFTVLAALSGMEREYIRDRTLEGHESARNRRKHIGGAAVTDEAMLSMALHLREQNPACATSPPGSSSPKQEERPASISGHRAAHAPRTRRSRRRNSGGRHGLTGSYPEARRAVMPSRRTYDRRFCWSGTCVGSSTKTPATPAGGSREECCTSR